MIFDSNSSDLKQPKPKVKLVYITPEKLSASKMLGEVLTSLYANKQIARFVIDEAHCIQMVRTIELDMNF